MIDRWFPKMSQHHRAAVPTRRDLYSGNKWRRSDSPGTKSKHMKNWREKFSSEDSESRRILNTWHVIRAKFNKNILESEEFVKRNKTIRIQRKRDNLWLLKIHDNLNDFVILSGAILIIVVLTLSYFVKYMNLVFDVLKVTARRSYFILIYIQWREWRQSGHLCLGQRGDMDGQK